MNRLLYFCLAFFLFPGGIALAQEELPEEEIDLFEAELELLAEEDVVIAAAKHKQKIGFSPSAVIVITRKDIDESGAVSLVDLLRRYPALYTIMINPSHHMVFARGSYRVLLLLDGRFVLRHLSEILSGALRPDEPRADRRRALEEAPDCSYSPDSLPRFACWAMICWATLGGTGS